MKHLLSQWLGYGECSVRGLQRELLCATGGRLGMCSDIKNSAVVGGTERWKGGGVARLVGFGGGGNDDCGERRGRTNPVVTSSFGCKREDSRSSTLVIRAMVPLDMGTGVGGMGSYPTSA